MHRVLLVSVRFHDGRYHGAGDWPPSPARLFQALVAGAARGQTIADRPRTALYWLENLDAPIIATPTSREGRGFKNFVPNNDLDAVGGDLRRIGAIRTSKTIRPHLFDAAHPFLYTWKFEPGEAAERYAQTIARIAECLYQLGRGVDMAWAWGEVIAAEDAEARLAMHGGVVYRPSKAGGMRAAGRPPVWPHTRVSVFFWPMRASSANHSSTRLPRAGAAPTRSNCKARVAETPLAPPRRPVGGAAAAPASST